ncbi:MAG: hypothetical protein ACYCX3_14095 [Thermoleophilia bacterium]
MPDGLLGFDIQPTVNSARATLGGGLRHLAAVGLEPATVIDVGAADGTHELYSAFPSAKRLLVEPLAESAAPQAPGAMQRTTL